MDDPNYLPPSMRMQQAQAQAQAGGYDAVGAGNPSPGNPPGNHPATPPVAQWGAPPAPDPAQETEFSDVSYDEEGSGGSGWLWLLGLGGFNLASYLFDWPIWIY